MTTDIKAVIMVRHKLTEEKIRKRILRAIKNDNHNTKYIIEACKIGSQYLDFCKVIADLQSEGLVVYTENGYFILPRK